MSFKRNTFDDDNEGSDNDQPFQKRQRFEGDGGRGGRGGRGRGRGRGDSFRGSRGGGGFRGRGGGGFNRFGNDDNDSGFVDRRGRGGFRGGGDRFNRDNRGGGGFRGRGGGRGFGGNRFDDRDRGRGRGGGRGRGFGDRRGGGFGGNRSFNDSIIKVNQDAPDFQNIQNENSENVSLRQFRGRYVVLFIYFKDGTYGCSTEQKAFRDLKSQFDKHNAVILGVSRDDPETHKDAITDSELNFSLLADTDSKIIKAYGALDDNNRVNLCTFIISPEGKIAAVWGRVFGFDKHPQEVLDKLREVASSGGTNASKKADHDNDNDDDQDDGDDNDNDNDNDDDNDDNNNPANDDDDDDDE